MNNDLSPTPQTDALLPCRNHPALDLARKLELQLFNARLAQQKSSLANQQMLDWIEWIIAAENTITMREEDGGFVLQTMIDENPNAFVGRTVREALQEAMQHYPIEAEWLH
jgi:hypothetical protein